MRGLYIHIPFCRKICSYCDFKKRVPKNKESISYYIKNLERDFLNQVAYLKDIKTIYIGGGTPSILDNQQLEELFLLIKKYIKEEILEYTIEVNPEDITLEKALTMQKYGINRVSIGVQTFNEDLLRQNNRMHTKKDVFSAIDLFNYIKIPNINLDLIYGLPNQTFQDVKNDLKLLKNLKITHISYYSLILEEKTILNHLLNKNCIELIDEDLELRMWEKIMIQLKNMGFIHYEISNYAKEGYKAIHNTLYWNLSEYLAIGAGACGYIENIRYENHAILPDYYLSQVQKKEQILINEQKKETFLLGLRMLEGVDLVDYQNKFHTNPYQDFPLEELIEKNLCMIENNYFKLTFHGLKYGNQVFRYFV